ncbi:MAG TPA: hypothetical protein VLT45_22355 [Kofleriaceae bacterium]|nr:hypothetical protein [Kofleriaceae bacterium]
MRSAIVVVPVCASLAAGALLGLQLRARPARPPALVVAPLPVAVPQSAARVPAAPSPRDGRRGASTAQPAATYEHPVGGDFLDSNLLLAYPDMPPALLEPHSGADAFRYGWRYEALARAMAKELAAVIDDACPAGCDASRETRDALQTWLDAGGVTETHALKRWKSDDDVAPTYLRRLAVHATAGNIALDVAGTASSDYLGMRGWNDDVTCDAIVRDRGRVLATYKPRHLTVLEHHTWLRAIDRWEQTVTFATAELVTTTGHDYEGDPDLPALVKKGVAEGPVWNPVRE